MHSWTNQSKAAYLDGKWNVIYIHKLPKLNSLSYRFHPCLDVCLAKIEVKEDLLGNSKGNNRQNITDLHLQSIGAVWLLGYL